MSTAELVASVVEALQDNSVRAGLHKALIEPAVATNNDEVARLIVTVRRLR